MGGVGGSSDGLEVEIHYFVPSLTNVLAMHEVGDSAPLTSWYLNDRFCTLSLQGESFHLLGYLTHQFKS